MYERAREFALSRAEAARELNLLDTAELIEDGVAQADELIGSAIAAYEDGNYQVASEFVRQAFNRIRAALLGAKEMKDEAEGAARTSRILATVERLNDAIQGLNTVLDQMEAQDLDVSAVKSELITASNLLSEAGSLAEAENADEAANRLNQAVEIIRRIREIATDARRSSMQERVRRIATAAENTIERLEQFHRQLQEHGREEAATMVEEAKNELMAELAEFNAAVQSGDLESAKNSLADMLSTMRRIRQHIGAERKPAAEEAEETEVP